MAPMSAPADLAILRSISARISGVKPQQLPHTVASQIQSLRDCSSILSQPRSSQQAGGESGVAVHRFNTQIAALLQGRSVEERWSAAVLIKGTVEVGGYEVLSKCKHWVTGLLSNLRRPDPPAARTIYFTTLTRIFILSRPYPSLIREITTPSLTPFIKTCLQNVKDDSRNEKELRQTLESFSCLLPHHSTTFRSHVSELRALLESVLGLADEALKSDVPYSNPRTRAAACRLSSLLHNCEPKQGAGPSWEREFRVLIDKSHRSLDTVLYDVDEPIEPASQIAANKSVTSNYTKTQNQGTRLRSILRNVDRLTTTLHLKAVYLRTGTNYVLSCPLREAEELLHRVLSVVGSHDPDYNTLKFGHDITIEERDMCINALPGIHLAALGLIEAIIDRFGGPNPGLATSFMSEACWLLRAEGHSRDIRTASYKVVTRALACYGYSMGKETVEQLTTVVRLCCQDLTESPAAASKQPNGAANGSGQDLLRSTSGSTEEVRHPTTALQSSAAALVAATYKHVPASIMPDSTRTLMDRTAVTAQQEDLLLASILNPGAGAGDRPARSLLPFLARQNPESQSVDAVLRPSMPVLHGRSAAPALYESHTNDHARDVSVDPDIEARNPHGPAGNSAEQQNGAHTQNETAGRLKTTAGNKRPVHDMNDHQGGIKRVRMAQDDTVPIDGSPSLPEAISMAEAPSSGTSSVVKAAHDVAPSEQPQHEAMPPQTISGEALADERIDSEMVDRENDITIAISGSRANEDPSGRSAIERVVSAPAAPQKQPSVPNGDESDDDDFVIPELTMEVTDDEDE